jgi:hypothetical protein
MLKLEEAKMIEVEMEQEGHKQSQAKKQRWNEVSSDKKSELTSFHLG